MQGFLSFFFITCYMLAISQSDAVIEESSHNPAEILLKEKYPEHRRKLPIFPKTNKKFVVTPKSRSVDDSQRQSVIVTRRPSKFRVTVKPRIVTSAKTQLISRKPLMKLRTFTVQSQANGKFNKIDKVEQNATQAKKIEIPNILISDKTDPVMPTIAINSITAIPEEIPMNGEKLIPLETNKGITQSKDKQIEESVIGGKNVKNYISEEEQDRSEFIFLGNNDRKLGTSDILDYTTQVFDEALETTTDYEIEIDTDMRVKRSQNVIEEENLASTVSGLKYTGRETRLISDVNFKNINT